MRVAVWPCCLAASLSLPLSFFFRKVLFSSPSVVVRTRMSHHREAPQRGQRKKKSLCALSQPEVVIDGRLNKTEEEKHTFCQALENRNHFYGGGEGGSTSLGLLLCMNVILQQQKIVLE